MDRQKALDKIKKLLDHAASAEKIGNEHEAAAFASAAQKMLLSHKLSMADVENLSELEAEVKIDCESYDWEAAGMKGKGKRCQWTEQLAATLAAHNGCKILVYDKSNKVKIIGSESSRLVVAYLLDILARFAIDSMNKEYRKQYHQLKKTGDTWMLKGFRRGFMLGFVKRIDERLEEQKSKDMAETVTERGLMVLDKEEQAVKDFMEENYNVRPAKKLGGRINHNGIEAGRNAGDDAHLKCNGVNDHSHKRIP